MGIPPPPPRPPEMDQPQESACGGGGGGRRGSGSGGDNPFGFGPLSTPPSASARPAVGMNGEASAALAAVAASRASKYDPWGRHRAFGHCNAGDTLVAYAAIRGAAAVAFRAGPPGILLAAARAV